MHNYTIDINADVGEGILQEARFFPLLSSCNIACGGHAGDHKSMQNCIQLALQHQVKIGVHPSYPDVENFGRVSLQIAPSILIHSLQNQISAFKKICDAEGAKIHHIKPHGALYNDMAKDISMAKLFLSAISSYKKDYKLYVPFGSVIAKEAIKEGFSTVYEAFLDRNYHADLSLVSRKESNAMLNDPKKIGEQLLGILKDQQIRAVTGEVVKIKASTFCIHGDSPAAFEILTYLHSQVFNHQITISK